MADESKTKEKLTKELAAARRRIVQLEALEKERTWAQQELRKTIRAFKVLSGCNQVIIRATEESKLLDEVCRVIVDVGGYRLAWVGFAVSDRKKTVRPVAQRGYEAGYLGTANITWADDEQGRGPTGTAIRTGKPSIVRDILTDSGYAPWRREAIRHGYASVIALPLRAEKQPFGALHIYATEPDAFDAEELELLIELANDLTYSLTALRNETRRKLTENALAVREKQLSLLFDSVGDVIYVLAVEPHNYYRFTMINQRFVEATGLSESQVVGKRIEEVIPEPAHALVLGKYREAIQTGQTMRWEEISIYPTGKKVGEVSVAPMFDANGKCTQLIGTVRDITEQRQLQEKLVVTDRLASIGQLVSGIAHELNNPLTGVIGFSELLANRKDLPADAKEDLNAIVSEARRAAQVVKGLLTFARKQGSEKQPVDVHSIIQGILQLRSNEQKVNNVEASTHFAPDMPQVIGNLLQLQQVFINIIMNAEQAIIEAHNKGKLTISTERADDMVRVSFADDGPGISPENMNKLFTPFFTTKETGKGTGLGLSICHGIVTEHGGKVYAESELGKGATFIVELPISK